MVAFHYPCTLFRISENGAKYIHMYLYLKNFDLNEKWIFAR